MKSRPRADAGKPVNFYDGKFAGRWFCLTPACPISISDLDHRAGKLRCHQCRTLARVEFDDFEDSAAETPETPDLAMAA